MEAKWLYVFVAVYMFQYVYPHIIVIFRAKVQLKKHKKCFCVFRSANLKLITLVCTDTHYLLCPGGLISVCEFRQFSGVITTM